MDGLDIVGMIVSPRSAHAARANVVRHDVAVVGEPFLAEDADAILRRNLSIDQLSHFRVRADLPIFARVLGIVDAVDSHLARASFSRDRFPAAAGLGAMNWAELISAESH